MKTTVVLGLMVAQLCACSHVKVVAFDRQARTVSIQAGRWDDERAVQKAAEDYCHGPVELLGMQEKTVGTHSTASASGYGHQAYGASRTSDVNREVFTYSCR